MTDTKKEELKPSPELVANWWNPLNDDGDALRLAVKLGLQVECRFGERDFVAVRTPCSNWREFREDTLTEHVPVATRRAIVRAAATCHTPEPTK